MRYTLFIIIALAASTVMAQPAKRRVTPTATAAQQNSTATKGTDRASLMFPTSVEMPEDVSWRREIYRQIDLNKDRNATLYYPVQPIGNQCNLFTYLFRLMLTGRVNAYDYKISGLESFADKDKVVISEFLRRYSIYYEENNGKITVHDADIPSEQVKRYYIKEATYLDQRTGVTKTKVLAICPILLEGGEFGEDVATPRPLFWMKYDDVAPYLSKLPVMAGDMNNVSNMTADDYFTMNRYDGKIYKTTNMQGKVLADYCRTDSDMVREQERIEKQLTDFQDNLWGRKSAETDESVEEASAAKSSKASEKSSKAEAKSSSANSESKKAVKSDDEEVTEPKKSGTIQRSLVGGKSKKSTGSSSARAKSAASKEESSSSDDAARVSARRERR